MREEIEFIMDYAKEQMQKALAFLDKELLKIRAGRATPTMLNGIFVDYYGSQTSLHQVSNINTPDARTISIQPWEKSMLDPIERAIINSNLGFNPMNNGELIIIGVPALTQERRLSLVRQVKAEVEEAKISIRNARKEANLEMKKTQADNGLSDDMVKNTEIDVQNLTNSFVKKADSISEKKQQEILTI